MRNGLGAVRGFITASAMLAGFLLLEPATMCAQDQSSQQSASAASQPASVGGSAKPADAAKAAPAFGEYKGVKIGMGAEEVRRLLGNPKDKSKEQDFFAFSERETAQVYYDGSGKVTAVAVSFYGGKSGVPAPAAVLGKEVEAKADGSLHHLERYPDAGYWVSYSRSAGDDPLVTVTMSKMP